MEDIKSFVLYMRKSFLNGYFLELLMKHVFGERKALIALFSEAFQTWSKVFPVFHLDFYFYIGLLFKATSLLFRGINVI